MKFVIKRARRGLLRRPQWTFRMIAENGEDLGPETYNNRVDCENTVGLIKEQAATAPVEWLDR